MECNWDNLRKEKMWLSKMRITILLISSKWRLKNCAMLLLLKPCSSNNLRGFNNLLWCSNNSRKCLTSHIHNLPNNSSMISINNNNNSNNNNNHYSHSLINHPFKMSGTKPPDRIEELAKISWTTMRSKSYLHWWIRIKTRMMSMEEITKTKIVLSIFL